MTKSDYDDIIWLLQKNITVNRQDWLISHPYCIAMQWLMRQHNNSDYGNRIAEKFIVNLFNVNFDMLTQNIYLTSVYN